MLLVGSIPEALSYGPLANAHALAEVGCNAIAIGPYPTAEATRVIEPGQEPPGGAGVEPRDGSLTVFISYGHSDTAAHAFLLHDRLRRRFGEENVFLDVAALKPGIAWRQAIHAGAGASGVLIVLIGARWLSVMKDLAQPMLVEPADDVVRQELELALRSQRDIEVVPVLVDDATMPAARELPTTLRGLTDRQVEHLSLTTYDQDVEGLIRRLEEIATSPQSRQLISKDVAPSAPSAYVRPSGRQAGPHREVEIEPKAAAEFAAAAAAAATPHTADAVDCTVFAPPSAAPGSLLLVQVFLHTPGQTDEATALATEFDPGSARRGFRGLELPLPRDTAVEIELSIPFAVVDAPVQRLLWQGRAEAVQFDVHVPITNAPPALAGAVIVRREGVPIGRVGFRIVISPDAEPSSYVPHTSHQHRFARAFASYASQDRTEVLKRVQVLRAAGIECFQDVLDLEPGQRWERELYRKIDRVDLFLLFWSRSAKRSKWVRREVAYALRRQEADLDAEPEIRPVILPPSRLRRFGRHRIEPPWQEVAHLHFNDLIAQLL